MTELVLWGNSLTDVAIVDLSHFLAHNQSITFLDLGGHKADNGARNLITDVGCSALASSLQSNVHCPLSGFIVDVCSEVSFQISLTSLSLEGNRIKNVGCRALADSLKFNTSLLCLNLSWNEILDDGCHAISSVVLVAFSRWVFCSLHSPMSPIRLPPRPFSRSTSPITDLEVQVSRLSSLHYSQTHH